MALKLIFLNYDVDGAFNFPIYRVDGVTIEEKIDEILEIGGKLKAGKD